MPAQGQEYAGIGGRRQNVEQFTSIEDARAKIEAWRIDYNHYRPHRSLGDRTPVEFMRHMQSIGTTEKAAISS